MAKVALNRTSNGSTNAASVSTGNHTITITGTFGSGTASIEASFDGTNWVAIPSSSVTAASMFNIYTYACNLRLTVTGATSPDITATILGAF